MLSSARFAALALAATGLAACESDSITGLFGREGTIAIQVQSAASLGGVTPTAAGTLQLSSGSTVIELSQISATIDRLELDRAESEPSDDDADDEDVTTSAFVIDVPLQGGVATAISLPAPTGRYDEVEARVRNVRLRGSYNGTSFDVTVPVDMEFESEFEPPIDVTESDPLRITFRLDAARWFRTSNGTLIDPTRISTDATLRAELRARIAAFFDAFEDEDRDGRDDDGDEDEDG